MSAENALILIVDDNFKNLQVLGSTLREAKFRTAIAMNGFEALDFVKEKFSQARLEKDICSLYQSL